MLGTGTLYPTLNPEQLRAFDPAVRDALNNAQEARDRLAEQLREANQYLLEVAERAHAVLVPGRPIEGRERENNEGEGDRESSSEEPAMGLRAVDSTSSSATTAEGREDEPKGGELISVNAEGGGKLSVNAEGVLLPKMIAGPIKLDKSLVIPAQTQATARLNEFDGDATRPERVVQLWTELSRLVATGLQEAQLIVLLQLLPSATQLRLAVPRAMQSIEDWRLELSRRYLSGTRTSDVLIRFAEMRRQAGEQARVFITRAEPLANAVIMVRAATARQTLGMMWSISALGQDYRRVNQLHVKDIEEKISRNAISTVTQLLIAVQQAEEDETVPDAKATPKATMPVATKAQWAWPECIHCGRRNHDQTRCWVKFPYLKPTGRGARDKSKARAEKPIVKDGATNEPEVKYSAVPVGRDVFVVDAVVGVHGVKMGLDSMAALNLIREDALAPNAIVQPGGPLLHGVGQVQSRGMIVAPVTLGGLLVGEVVFAVVTELPVQALLGKPTLAQLRARIDMANDTAAVSHGRQTTLVHAVAAPVALSDSSRPDAQSYWNWINKRVAAAPKRLQTLFQDVMERADNVMLEQFLAEFPDWALRARQMSNQDDPAAHPAPYQRDLTRVEAQARSGATSGVVVCPVSVKATDILAADTERDLVAVMDDNKDFLPPIMSDAEDDRRTEEELARMVTEADLSSQGKTKLAAILQRYRPAFGMQLRKVDMSREPVHTHTTGELPAHQPRRLIRDPRVLQAQMEWEDAMMERGVIGPLTGDPELARPLNIHHVIRNSKIRFTADARARNDVTVPDSHPVPSPMEALERFRRNKLFSTFDEADSYFQYPYDVESRVPFYSAHGGVREFRVVIQGGKNSPAALHRFKAKQYAEFSADELAYMFDDSLLGTPGGSDGDHEAAHLELLERFLANCVKHGTILKPSKSHPARAEVVHQGFVLSHGHYRKDPKAVQPLVDMRLPVTASELKSQLSMLGRYRSFVPDYSQVAAPLEAIMDARWKEDTFQPIHAERLLELRRQVAQATMLIMPDWNRPFHWRIDAQPTYGWAGVVGQEDEQGKFWPIRFMSKKATDADRKRWPTEMEAMAWYYCLIEKGHLYSQYSKNVIHGDPKSLRWLADSIESGRANRQMQRVAMALQGLDIEFQYHPRDEMTDVDTLSKFAVAHHSSKAELERFLATDNPMLEQTLSAAPVMSDRALKSLPARFQTGGQSVVVAAALGPDSVSGVPLDIVAEQKLDPVCKFIVMTKRHEFTDEAAADAFLSSMPVKAAAVLRHHMQATKSRDFEAFELRNGKLMYVDVDQLAHPRVRLVVPERLRVRVLTANHDAPAAGHRGFDKTYGALMRLYFWFGMYADAKAWIASCPSCAKGKRRTIAGHGTAKHVGLVPTKYPPYDRVVIDLIGPLIESRDGMRHILIIVDAFSSETVLEPLKSKNSEDIANILLRRVVLREGCPRSWQTDRAPELIAGAVAKLAALAGIEAKACSSYQAHTEGRVERRNWLVEMMLREMAKDDPAGWPEMLPWVEFAINSSPYSVTGMTPYFHKTGYDPIAPANAWREVGEDRGEPVGEWSKRMRKAYVFAELAQADAAAARKEQYDKGKHAHGISVGDKVYVWMPREHKLQQSAIGPVIMKRFLDPATERTAVVHPPGRPDETMVVHVDRLIRAQDRPAHLIQIPPDVSDWIQTQQVGHAQPEAVEIDAAPQVTRHQRSMAEREQEVWSIAEIVGRVEDKDGARRYCVRYTGYDDPKDNRWYDEADLRAMGAATERMLDAFDASEDASALRQHTMPRAAQKAGVRQSARLKEKQAGDSHL